jgi:hypothetical protein
MTNSRKSVGRISEAILRPETDDATKALCGRKRKVTKMPMVMMGRGRGLRPGRAKESPYIMLSLYKKYLESFERQESRGKQECHNLMQEPFQIKFLVRIWF